MPFPIVGIGASAGGLEAFTQLLKQLPVDTGMGFVLVQHLDPQHDSALTQLAGASHGDAGARGDQQSAGSRPTTSTSSPPNTSLGIAGGVLKLQPRAEARLPLRSSIPSSKRWRRTSTSGPSA